MTTTAPPPPPKATAAPTPALRRSAWGRPLSWRNPWTLLLGVLAAFQAGVITTLLWTSGQSPGGNQEAAVARSTPPAVPPAAGVAPPVAPLPLPIDPEIELEPTPPVVDAGPARAPGRPPRDRGPRSAPPADGGAPPSSGEAPPSPPTGDPDALVEVEIGSDPEGATVRIAGAVWGVTPLTAFLPATAPVVIKLDLDGYAPARLSWSPASKRALSTVLKPLENP